MNPTNKMLYGPVADDLVFVEDMLESTKDVEISALKRMLDHALEARGKRLRPALVLLAGTFGDYQIVPLSALGAAIELLHTASLVHDDVVDGALSRRGRPTANSVWDNSLTVLLGDYMFANAAEMVTRTGSLPVTRLFALALMKMTSGELDQDAAAFELGKDIQQYLFRIGGKTASLITNSAEGGAVLAGCDDATVEAMRTYGYCLGMAFQIVDDILDYIGDEAELGKPAGSDLLEGTITLPALFYLETAPKNNPVRRYMLAKRNRDALLLPALDAVRDSDVIERSYEVARDYVRRACNAIENLPETEAKAALLGLTAWVLSRRS